MATATSSSPRAGQPDPGSGPSSRRFSALDAEKCIRNAGPIFRVSPSLASGSASRDTVSFTLQPPTIHGEDADSSFSSRVYNEWVDLPSQAAASRLTFFETTNTFRFNLLDPERDEFELNTTLASLSAAALQEAVRQHLTKGGDERSHVSKGGNKYFCPPHPVPDAVVRGTCTCSPPSRTAFDAACAKLSNIWNGIESVDEAFDDIRYRISSALAFQTSHHVVLHPSGTDAEYTPLLIGAATARALSCTGIVNVVVGLGEVGSNTPNAAGGQHFSRFLPNGGIITEATNPLTDAFSFPEGVQVLPLSARQLDGSPVPNFDQLVLDTITNLEARSSDPASNSKPFFILHAVDGSKLGSRITTRKLVTAAQALLGSRVLVVLDACQGRTETVELDWYLARNAVVLMTASKFYSAPGFCGMAVVPDTIASFLQNINAETIPEGLGGYLTQYQVPRNLTGLRNALPAEPVNIGLLLRWACGLAEMERFGRAGAPAREGIRRWVDGVMKLIRQEHADTMEIMTEGGQVQASQLGGVNSIVAFKLLADVPGAEGKKPLQTPALKRIHQWLTADVSGLLPGSGTESERSIAALRCFIGQPVDIGDFAVLRLAIGAPLATELGEDLGRLETSLDGDRRILEKIEVLLKYHEVMK